MALRFFKRTGWLWLAYLGLWTLLGLAFAGQLYLSRANIGNPVSWSFALGRALADWYGFGLLALPAIALVRRVPVAHDNWVRPLALHVGAGVLFSVAWMVLRAWIEHWQSATGPQRVSFGTAFAHALVATFFFNLIIYGVVVSATNAAIFYLKYQERALRAAELEAHLSEAKLMALRMQLNPHFLFNTLHSIAALMHKDVEAADRMLTRLGDLLRLSLDGSDQTEVPLRRELAFLDRYLEIEKIRFGPRLEVSREIDPETWDAMVPNLILQPLVENAIRHGIEPNARPGQIQLRARIEQDNQLALTVSDNGNGMTSASREGIGLSNTRARLEEIYPGQHAFTLGQGTAGGLEVRLTLPLKRAPVAKESPRPAASYST